jgi:NTP pyrophosphatase (non-canonical NTP hydrolase)
MIRAATHPMANDSKWKQEELFELVAAVKKANAKAFQDEITEDTLTRVVTGATLLQVFLGERRDLRKINVRVKFIQQALKKMAQRWTLWRGSGQVPD